MKNSFFEQCTTSEEVRKRYRELCRLNHPDLGPKEETEQRTRAMQEINNAYALACATFRQDEMRERYKARGWKEPTPQNYKDAAEVDERIRQAIENIITLEGLEVEVCGLWVWVGGETKEHREQLKAAEYKWAPQKEKWYFAGVPCGKSRGWDMERIRHEHGSTRITRPSRGAMREVES